MVDFFNLSSFFLKNCQEKSSMLCLSAVVSFKFREPCGVAYAFIHLMHLLINFGIILLFDCDKQNCYKYSY